MNRCYLRVAALSLVVYLCASSSALAAPRTHRDVISGPGERVARIVKQVRNFLRGFTSQDDGMLPPVPKP